MYCSDCYNTCKVSRNDSKNMLILKSSRYSIRMFELECQIENRTKNLDLLQTERLSVSKIFLEVKRMT